MLWRRLEKKKRRLLEIWSSLFFNIDWIFEVEISFAWLLVHVLTAWFLLHLLHLYLLCQRHSWGEERDILTWFWKKYCRSDCFSWFIVVLMAEIPNNHLGCIKPFENNGINDISTGAGLLPSTELTHWGMRESSLNPVTVDVSSMKGTPLVRPLAFILLQWPRLLGETDPMQTCTWNLKHPLINGCFNWMIPNLYTGSCCFTKHPC